jgi:peptidoglycan hydrolase-like protein with peptidoglycan-binding domain
LLQWSLTQLGYYRGAIGGNYGERTFDATFRFQLDNGLGRTAPGSVSVNTWSWLKYYLC